MWLSGKRFVKNGMLKYENASMLPKFVYYHLVFFGYLNRETDSTNTGTIVCGYCKHYICQMYLKRMHKIKY
jgi:hypothetical protein